jgi:hypothetical protein
MTPIDWNDSEPGFPDHLPPKVDGGLTGNRRFRVGKTVGCYGALVLEVEYSVFVKTLGKWNNLWRPATAADITPAETVIG